MEWFKSLFCDGLFCGHEWYPIVKETYRGPHDRSGPVSVEKIGKWCIHCREERFINKNEDSAHPSIKTLRQG